MTYNLDDLECVKCCSKDLSTLPYKAKNYLDTNIQRISAKRVRFTHYYDSVNIPTCEKCRRDFLIWDSFEKNMGLVIIINIFLLIAGIFLSIFRFTFGFALLGISVILFVFVHMYKKKRSNKDSNRQKYIKFDKISDKCYVKPRNAPIWVKFNDWLKYVSNPDLNMEELYQSEIQLQEIIKKRQQVEIEKSEKIKILLIGIYLIGICIFIISVFYPFSTYWNSSDTYVRYIYGGWEGLLFILAGMILTYRKNYKKAFIATIIGIFGMLIPIIGVSSSLLDLGIYLCSVSIILFSLITLINRYLYFKIFYDENATYRTASKFIIMIFGPLGLITVLMALATRLNFSIMYTPIILIIMNLILFFYIDQIKIKKKKIRRSTKS